MTSSMRALSALLDHPLMEVRSVEREPRWVDEDGAEAEAEDMEEVGEEVG